MSKQSSTDYDTRFQTMMTQLASTNGVIKDKQRETSQNLRQGIFAITELLSSHLLNDFTKDLEKFKSPSSIDHEIKDNFHRESFFEFERYRDEVNESNIIFGRSICHMNLFVFSLKSKNLMFFDQSSQKVIVDPCRSHAIVCMDFEVQHSLFLFAFSNGNVQFARWEGNYLRWIEKPVSAFKKPPFEVKMIQGSWLVLGSVANESDELIMRLDSKVIKYSAMTLKYSKPAKDSSAGLSITVLRNKVIEGVKLKQTSNLVDRNWVVISYNGHEEVNFYTFLLNTSKGQFSSYDEDTFRNIFNAKNPKLSNLKPNSVENNAKISSNEDPIFEFKTIVLFSKSLWIPADHEYVLVIWGNILQQFLITSNLDFKDSFSLSLPFNVVHALISGTELLMVLTEKFDVKFIDLARLRYRQTIHKITHIFQEEKILFSGGGEMIILPDFSESSVCVFSNHYLQTCSLIHWEAYINGIKSKSYTKTLFVLSKMVSQQPVPLKGAIYPGHFPLGYTDFELTQAKLFNDRLKAVVGEVIVDMLKWLANDEDGSSFVELFIWLLINTGNFELLFDRLLKVVLKMSGKGSAKPMAQVFIERLAKEMTSNILEQSMTIFFAQIDQFDGIDDVLMQFFFYLIYRFDFSEPVFLLLKMVAQKKKFVLVFLFLLLSKPTDQTTLSDFADIIKASSDAIIVSKSDAGLHLDAIDVAFCYIFDVFNSQKFFKIAFSTVSQIEHIPNLRRIQSSTEQWVFQIAIDFLLQAQPMKLFFTLLEMYSFYSFTEETPDEEARESFIDRGFKTSQFDEILINGCLVDFDQFFMNVITRSPFYEAYFVTLAFVFFHTEMSFNEKMVPTIFNRMLNPNVIRQMEENKSIDSNLFLIVFFNFYRQNREGLIKFSFDQLIEPRIHESEIIRFIYNDLRNNIGDNFQFMLSKSVFFNLYADAMTEKNSKYAKDHIHLFKKHCQEILEKDVEKFILVSSSLPTKDIEEILASIGNRKDASFRILKKVAVEHGNEGLTPEMTSQFFSLICENFPEDIVDFLDRFNYDVKKVMAIMERFNRQQGIGYLAYKMGDTPRAIRAYFNQVDEKWKSSDFSQTKEKEIDSLFFEMMSFNMEDKMLTDFLISFILFVKDLSGREKQKERMFKNIFSRLFNHHCHDLYSILEEKNLLGVFLKEKNLLNHLMFGYRNQIELNSSIKDIFAEEVKEAGVRLIDRCRNGSFFEPRNCKKCKSSDFSRANPLCLHKCGCFFHWSCEAEAGEKEIKCPGCLFDIVYQPVVDNLARRRSSIKPERYSGLARNKDEIFIETRIFEAHLDLKNEHLVQEFDKMLNVKRGLQLLDVKAHYFDI